MSKYWKTKDLTDKASMHHKSRTVDYPKHLAAKVSNYSFIKRYYVLIKLLFVSLSLAKPVLSKDFTFAVIIRFDHKVVPKETKGCQ